MYHSNIDFQILRPGKDNCKFKFNVKRELFLQDIVLKELFVSWEFFAHLKKLSIKVVNIKNPFINKNH